jgi:hypothetical protein
MSNRLVKLIEELDRQKKIYHERTSTSDAQYDILYTLVNEYDYIRYISNIVMSELLFSALVPTLTFSVNLDEVLPLSLDFIWRLPTPEEMANGVNIVFESFIPPEITALTTFIQMNFKAGITPDIEKSELTKGYFGISYYGYSYYDPVAVREFIRNTIVAMFKKHPTLTDKVAEVEALAKTLNISPEIAKNLFNRVAMVIALHEDCMMMDYGLLDYTLTCREAKHSEELGVVSYIDYDNQLQTVEVYNLAQVMWGCILDESVMDYCFLFDDLDPYKDEYKELAPGVKVPGAPIIFDVLWDKVRRFRDRLLLMPLAVANYVRSDEAIDYHKCERTEVWGELMSYRYMIDGLVEQYLSNLGVSVDPFNLNKYKRAVNQLVGHLGKRHRWGYEIYRLLSSDELKSWWVDYWSTQGLNPEILNKLYEVVSVWLKQVVQRKVELGLKLRLQRLGL